MPEGDEEFRDHLTPEREDDPGWNYPSAPSQVRRLPDDELMRLYRKLSRGNQHPWDRRIELELIGRFTVALKGFRQASEKASQRLELATWVLIVLTIVIAVFTVALFLRD
jgi:hypothetical protein